ncbi:MAG: hypothetical protein KDC46_02305 [Thermoleophilia bacterium]|nr:hypothetical protein [Thermoleophilia bacterium]
MSSGITPIGVRMQPSAATPLDPPVTPRPGEVLRTTPDIGTSRRPPLSANTLGVGAITGTMGTMIGAIGGMVLVWHPAAALSEAGHSRLAMALALGVTGISAIAGGYAGFRMATDAQRASEADVEHKRVLEAYGTPTAEAATDVLTSVDANHDSRLDIGTEHTRPGVRHGSYSPDEHGELRYTSTWTEPRDYTPLLQLADSTGTPDGRVDADELAQAMARWDVDRNGALDASELGTLNAAVDAR